VADGRVRMSRSGASTMSLTSRFELEHAQLARYAQVVLPDGEGEDGEQEVRTETRWAAGRARTHGHVLAEAVEDRAGCLYSSETRTWRQRCFW
jgi:hypothetical protein